MNNEMDNMAYARINITLPKDILEKVEKQRIKEKRNLSNMIVCMMEFYIENKDKVK
jgi:metal-responsive CopG/Arc/MetJ family transcriptional regulator